MPQTVVSGPLCLAISMLKSPVPQAMSSTFFSGFPSFIHFRALFLQSLSTPNESM